MRLSLDEHGAVWYCHHCGDRGNEYIEHTGVKKHRNTVKNTDLKTIQPPESALSDDAIAYLKSRAITAETAKACDIVSRSQYFRGHGEDEAIGFQYFLPNKNKPVGVKWRSITQKLFAHDGTAKTFWNISHIDPEQPILIVEGEMDALSCIEAGWPNVLSVPAGASNVGPDSDIEYLWRAEEDLKQTPRILLGLDMDEPGQALTNEIARRLGRAKCFQVNWEEKDANATLDIHGPNTVIACIDAAEPFPVDGLYAANHYADAVMELYDTGRERGFDPELGSMGEIYTVQPGQITLITGIPGMGKSEMLDQITVNMCIHHGWRIAVWSAENPPVEHIGKLLEKKTEKPFFERLYGRMSKEEAEAALAWVHRHYQFIDTSNEGNTIENILDKAEAAVLRSGIKGLILDPFNYIDIDRSVSGTDAISDLINKVRAFARAYDVHIWFVAHPAKLLRENGKTPIPTGYDVAGSAHWFNKTDVGVTVHRNTANQTEFHVWKCRFKWIGEKGMKLYDYDVTTGCYTPGFDYGEETQEGGFYIKD